MLGYTAVSIEDDVRRQNTGGAVEWKEETGDLHARPSSSWDM